MNAFQCVVKKGLTLAFFSLLLVLGFCASEPAFAQNTPEKINSFSVNLELDKNAELTVTETIRYDFGTNHRHGIFRNIPLLSSQKTKMGITLEEVTDEKGNPYQVSTSGGSIYRIQVGDPNKIISGEHTYIIRYIITGAPAYFDEYDELYWNVTGNEWEVPIEYAEVRLVLPQDVSASQIQSQCYVGVMDSTATCRGQSTYEAGVYTASASNLNPGEGITIAVGFPKEVITQPWLEKARAYLWILWLIFLALIFPGVLAYSFINWYRHGRDPKGRGVIIPEYDIPEGLSVLEVVALRSIKSAGLNNKALTGALLELAVQGFIKITVQEKDGFFIDTKDYIFTRTEKKAESEVQKALLSALFGTEEGASIGVALSSLKNTFYKEVPKIQKAAYKSITDKGLYDKRQGVGSVKHSLIVVALVVIIAYIGFNLGSKIFPGLQTPWWGIVALIASAITAFFFALVMEKVTPAGALVKERTEGLKEYLQIAEKNRLEFHNAPEKKPELFEKLLPVAVVLGVEEAWAKEFADLTMRPPEWYSGAPGSTFSAQAFTTDLEGFSKATSTALSAPSSGSGGGGFSGGGGGGGGGGSW